MINDDLKTIRLGELRKMLAPYSDDLEVCLRLEHNDGDESTIGGAISCEKFYGCANDAVLVIDGSDDAYLETNSDDEIFSDFPEDHFPSHYMYTATAKTFYPIWPRIKDLYIEDIGRSLAKICRFGGHVRPEVWHYSVAEHSVRVACVVRDLYGGSRQDQLYGLLHDAAEAYLGDMIWPVKQYFKPRGYKKLETRTMKLICEKFGLPMEEPSFVKCADLILLATEKRDLRPVPGVSASADLERQVAQLDHKNIPSKIVPLDETIFPMDAKEAYLAFMSMFETLTTGGDKTIS